MLKIGDFSGITGLSIKALRHYDDKSVLVPESVDEQSGYRLYAENQVRSGVIVRALRAAGVPLQAVMSVNDEKSALQVLEAHREQALADRAKEDQTYLRVSAELRALASPVNVVSRREPPQLFVGRTISATLEPGEELSDDEVNDSFAKLYERLVRAGVQLSGTFWTTMRADSNGGVEVIGCWEVAALPEPGILEECEIAESLPARTDLVATWNSIAGAVLPEGSTHPAVVALFDACVEHQLELNNKAVEIRQSVLGQSESDFSVEVSITIEEQTDGS